MDDRFKNLPFGRMHSNRHFATPCIRKMEKLTHIIGSNKGVNTTNYLPGNRRRKAAFSYKKKGA